jgi:hypothetical protein
MKIRILFISFLMLSFALHAKKITITVTNPNEVAVTDAPVVVNLDLYKKICQVKRNSLAVFIDKKQISSELDDMNKDGIPDELVFLIDLPAKGSKQIDITTIAENKRIKFPAEMYTDLIVKQPDGSKKFVTEVSSTKNNMYNALHHHGVAFESAIIGYRIYFDNKSTIDVYGKKKQQLELATTGWYPTDEQAAAGFGDDVIRVFSSVGVGSVKGWDGKKATHIDKFDKRTQKILIAGNLRTIVESNVEGWMYEGKKINLSVRYIMYARHRDVVCEVTANENIDRLATGVQTIAGGPVFSDNQGLVGSWGTDYPVTDTIKYEKQTCGLGVCIPHTQPLEYVTEGLNNLYLLPYKKSSVLRFYLTAVAMKEEKAAFTSSDQFFQYLQSWSKSLKELEIK